MTAEYKTALLALLWVAAVAAEAVLGGTATSMAWLMVLVAGMGSSVLIWLFWQAQPHPTAESLHEARR